MRNDARLLCASLLLSACGGVTKSAHSELEGQMPNELKADYQSFLVNCSKCHDVDRALNAHVDDVRHWDLYVAKMMRTAGSGINAAESPRILRFLYWYTEHENKKGDAEKAGKRLLPELKPEDVNEARAKPSAGAEATPAAAPPAAPEPAAPETTSPAPGTQGETAP